ncbi:TraR/DksA C4-type zinc finger protein [Spongiactinospora sp. TRM90649]|uniref:TraR/DksA family transcriptional regulator n=1 Tax=Spongiactinospora sp. TRM90649 TaxID=3031114 RepID=UPI0023F83042|nr:TraR/DksA C4-type zinc finger protein [Spongiactinospora sp. TRM90649]MDF5754292.1 TraR/DksA C4-type zinc finger protein [Spongiactinospora sp. TRM90649]
MTEEEGAVRERLEADRRATTARIATLRGDRDEIVASASSSADDEHDPEGTSTAFERAHLQALLDQALAHLAELDRAEERLRDGTYGVCASCGRRIAGERLSILPATTTCVACASKRRR